MLKEKGYYQKRRFLKNANYLDITPIRKYRHEVNSDGNVVILLPRFRGAFSRRFLQPRLKNPFIKIELDKIGSVVWLLTNGKTNVKNICIEAENQLGKTIHPVYERVTKFYSQLYLKKLITFNEILK
jgi:hypothetical protein